jgi:hypothetical protein
MKMIPPVLPPRATGTEAAVFRLLGQVHSPNAFALCSLNLSEHEYKKWGEIDFVVVSEEGLLVLEVKGGQVHCDRGIWRYESREHVPVERSESPMAQASSAYFELRRHLNREVGRALTSQAPSGFGVILAKTSASDAESRGLVGGSEMVRPLVGAREDVRDVDAFGALLSRFLGHWRSQQGESLRNWSPTDVAAVVGALRPWFDRIAPLSIAVARVRQEQLSLTAEQYQVLDFSQTADRVLITGGAGSGKTLLAVECLRRERSNDPLFVTGTESLARHLRAAMVDDPSRVYSFQELAKVPAGRRQPHGCLIVDEGQQVTNAESLSLLTGWLEGGLDRGRWRWFSDPNNQVLPDARFDSEQHEFLRRLSFPGTLTRNCRTTPQIAQVVQLLTGASIGDSTTKGQGPEVSFANSNVHSEQVLAAAAAIRKWLEDPEIAPGDIVLISPKPPAEWSIPEIAVAAKLAWRPWQPGWGASSEQRRSLAAATVDEFRGMESPFVVLCDMDTSVKEPAGHFYLGMTRANFGLVVLADATVVQQLVDRAMTLRIHNPGV